MSSFYLKQAGVKCVCFRFLLAGGGRRGGSVSLCTQGPSVEKDRRLARRPVFLNWTVFSLPSSPPIRVTDGAACVKNVLQGAI